MLEVHVPKRCGGSSPLDRTKMPATIGRRERFDSGATGPCRPSITRSTRTTSRADGGASEKAFRAKAQGNAPEGATVKILEYKDMEPFFIKGERDEP
jgi:hypothetical protein